MIRELTLSFCFSVVCASAGGQTTIHVPADQPTIQAGIDAASPGDTVLVAPGVYLEHDIVFNGKAIHVVGERGADATIVDAQRLGRGFLFASGEGPTSILEGFTIVRGMVSTQLDRVGGGIYCKSSSPHIKDCVVTGCAASGAGGGICLNQSSAVIERCSIRNNFTVPLVHFGTSAGGVYVIGGAATFLGCEFAHNRVDVHGGEGDGGGMYILDGTTTLDDCAFIGNRAADGEAPDDEGGNGGAVYLETGSHTINGCRFIGNQAGRGGEAAGGGFGGAIHVVFGATVSITNSVLSYNKAGNDGAGFAGSGGAGGAFSSNQAGQITVRNCVVTGNASGMVEVGPVYTRGPGGGIAGAATVVNSIVRGNLPDQVDSVATVTFSNVEGGFAGSGNIDAAPGLDLHDRLVAGSPCIDAGDPSGSGLPAADFQGDPRVMGAAVDIGIDEFQQGAATYPGTGEDFMLATGVDDAPTAGIGHEVKTASAGDILEIELDSPGGTFDFTPPFLLLQPFVTGAPPTGGVIQDLIFGNGPLDLLVNGFLDAGTLGQQTMLPGGNRYRYLLPAGLVGTSLLVQGVVTSPALAANGQWAVTDAHEIQMLP